MVLSANEIQTVVFNGGDPRVLHVIDSGSSYVRILQEKFSDVLDVGEAGEILRVDREVAVLVVHVGQALIGAGG
jgi:hypothetical protein